MIKRDFLAADSAVHPGRPSWQGAAVVGLMAVMLLSAGCATRRASSPAPVEDRIGGAVTDVKPLPGAENAGKAGFYTVKPGDTLFRIALDSGQSWRDIQAWNNLTNPNILEVGQILRVQPPGATPPPVAAVTPPAATPGTAAVTPVAPSGVVPRPLSSSDPVPLAPATPSATTPATPAVPPNTDSAGADELNFVWPAQGTVIAGFDEAKNKGVSIAGRVGDPVIAAADGRVVYAGAGLRGYGNLVILKHNNTYLTAYAHNQALLVREDQSVRQGQKIAEMGSSDTDRVKLHFEVRRQGKPVDPLNHLPRR
ncbi:lipoprotein NlpD [Hydrogenophaga palleronii]|uniref:Lipoprotein NlpD n=2 Tax=Hydrogenophaga palleronii TaxID=65655 RepID=A0ABU1WJT0_9BURK|nr:lipoprotein NlpD [Hydrogenophaga palleronii]